jgi:hypothetical protein
MNFYRSINNLPGYIIYFHTNTSFSLTVSGKTLQSSVTVLFKPWCFVLTIVIFYTFLKRVLRFYPNLYGTSFSVSSVRSARTIVEIVKE